MKICIIAATLNHGGASIIALDVAKGMAQRGHEILFVCSGESAISYEQDGYLVRVLGLKRRNPFFHYLNPSLLLKVNTILTEFQPDIIHVHNINLQTFSLVTLLFSRQYPMVWTLHDIWALCMTGWPDPSDCNGMLRQCHGCPTWPNLIVRANKFIKEVVYKHSPLSVVSPSYWLASLLRVSSLSRKPVHVIHNGIEPTSFASVAGSRDNLNLGIPARKKILLFCGGKRLAGQLPAERKGGKYLYAALEILGRKRSDIHLLYVGDSLDLPSQFSVPVTFAEGIAREEMKNYYSASDIFVLPTLADNSPLTILEAMACKVPVVACNVGGIAEAVTHGETGLLCPPRNAEALVESIEYLLSNPKRGIEMAEKAYKRFINRFTFEQMIDGYEAVYRQAISDVTTA